MSPRTVFLAKLFGLLLILLALPMLIERQAYVDLIAGLVRDPLAILAMGIMSVAAGLAMVLAHNVWSGGALPVVVTVLGWLTLAKGVVFLFLFSGAELAGFLGAFYHSQICYYAGMGICLVLGIYLAYGGFAWKSAQS